MRKKTQRQNTQEINKSQAREFGRCSELRQHCVWPLFSLYASAMEIMKINEQF